MSTTQEDIRGWFELGQELEKDYMLIVCDSFDYSDYPVYCSAENYEKEYRYYSTSSMQKIMESYQLNDPIAAQLEEFRAFHYPDGFSP